jgi:sialidase-1
MTTIHTYRIPAIVKTSTGRLVAFCEARRDGSGDYGAIGVVKKYSDDGGATWAKFAGGDFVAAWDATYMFGNPTAVVKSTRVWLFCNRQRIGDDEGEIIAGTGVGTREVFVTYSDDNGATFAAPADITAAAKPSGHRWHACGPGAGIVADSGRIVVPYNSTDGDQVYHAGVFYSDDDGATWALGTQVTDEGTNEAAVVELTGGNLTLNCRRYPVTAERNRLVFTSADEGATWGAGAADTELVDPSVDAAIINIGGTLVFSNPKDATSRINLTVRKSADSGDTWSAGKRISTLGQASAYSDLVDLGSSSVGCLWERGGYQEIVFCALPLSAL